VILFIVRLFQGLLRSAVGIYSKCRKPRECVRDKVLLAGDVMGPKLILAEIYM
jgi:hypothetical protein